MRHYSWFSSIAMLCLLIVSLDACTSSPPASGQSTPLPTGAGQAPPLTKVDWKNFTYISSCYSDKPRPFKVVNGVGVVDGVHLEVYQPVFGDLTGDGQPEAAIPYSCTAADFGGVRVFVYTGDARKPVLLGELPLPPPDTNYSVDIVTIDHGMIQLVGRGYSASAPHCCPDLHVNNLYRWNGSRFVLVRSNVTPLRGG